MKLGDLRMEDSFLNLFDKKKPDNIISWDDTVTREIYKAPRLPDVPSVK